MQTSRYQLVDSLYGPGTVGAWLLTIHAVFIRWTLNRNSRRKDGISVDLIAVLLLPLIAAGHLVFQVVRLPTSVAEVITTKDIEMEKFASALEAPLNICETFSVAALLLAMCCGPWWNSKTKWKRLGLIALVGLISWATENLMFAMATMRGVHFVDATLSRPYFFFLTPVVASSWGFLAIVSVILGVLYIQHRVNVRNRQDSERDVEKMLRRTLYQDNSGTIIQALTSIYDTRFREYEYNSRNSKLLAATTMIFTPLSFITSFFSMPAKYQIPQTPDQSTFKPHFQFFLIPRSSTSLSNLDQILALLGGIIVLFAEIRQTYLSRVRKDDTLERVIQRRQSI